ncbi:MAG: PD-(D/E)XK nuclease family protein [Petrotogales bacterium]
MKCPHCNDNKNTIKAGIRNTRIGSIQKYYCKSCNKYFTDTVQPHIQYPLKVILYTLESYNKGYPVIDAKKLAGKKYRYSPPTRTIYSWVDRYKDTLTFLKLRKKYSVDPEELLTTHRFNHQQIYPFTYHKLKLNLHSKKLPQLRRYINWIDRSLPTKMFLSGPRASSTEFEHNIKPKQKDSIIPELTRLALTTSQKSKSAHETIEQFLLINDSNTICTELPVFLNPDEIDTINLDTPLTGHIDLVQIRYGKLYILDYKPNLRHPEQFGSQLLLYQKAVQKRTSIPEKNIIPAVFNEHSYYELR